MKLKNQHLTRQLDLVPTDVLGEPITIIGAGAVGSWVTLQLAKMGFGDITVIDFDKVDIENMNSQFYRFQDIGLLKVDCLQRLVEEFTGLKIETVDKPYVGGMFSGIVISAVDSMDVRRLIWENHKGKAVNTKAIIDPRMAIETALLYVMNPVDFKDIEGYEKLLHSDEDSVQDRCTNRATVYTANLLSGLVVKAVKDLLVADKYSRSTQWDIKENDMVSFSKPNR